MGSESRVSFSSGGSETAPIEPTAKARRQLDFSIRWIGSDGAHRVSHLRESKLAIGRDDTCDIVLPGAGTSRRHCVIQRSGGFVVEDLKSRNGVFVDGNRIDGTKALADQSILRIGDWVGVLAEGDSTFHDAAASGLWGTYALRHALERVRAAARAGLRILILGETGTGKELAARAVKGWAGRPGKFIDVNCAALPRELAESELFGHQVGAFTGATRGRLGHVQESSGGVLFLDEVGELPLPLQAKLLRVLQEASVTPVGSSTPVGVDLCVVAATHRDLAAMVRANEFREDLLMRLQGAVVRLPPLRQRRGDIWPLFEVFVRPILKGRMPEVSARFVEALHTHAWPGNVRELKQFAEGLAALDGGAAKWDTSFLHFADEAPEPNPAIPSGPPRRFSRRNPPSADQIRDALKAAGGGRQRAADLLGIAKNTFLAIAKDLGVKLDQ